MVDDKALILSRVCASLSDGDAEQAGRLLQLEYPFQQVEKTRRSYSRKQMVETFVRDGFIDRYSGERLVFPASLVLISLLLPHEFPYPPSGKMSESHVAFWELWPTIDHIVPVAKGGTDDPSNWACTSMLRNSVKSNWTLEEIGWSLRDGGRMEDWDGLMGWFLEYTEENTKVLEGSAYLHRWRVAAEAHSI
ncbi:MAG: HNH endonuclease [Actinomycetota bacterium]|nr:HNH endonuclease [Actinomycetota bacterium]